MSVYALASSASHHFSKEPVQSFTLVTGLGVEGDCHSGQFVQHLSRVKLKPRPANLRQVHLIPLEILRARDVEPGQIGENVTTSGIDLLALGKGTKLHFYGAEEEADTGEQPHAVVVVQGVRNPCPQIDNYRPGLKESFIKRNDERAIVGRTAGVMGTVESGGPVAVGMRIVVEPPPEFHELACV